MPMAQKPKMYKSKTKNYKFIFGVVQNTFFYMIFFFQLNIKNIM